LVKQNEVFMKDLRFLLDLTLDAQSQYKDLLL